MKLEITVPKKARIKAWQCIFMNMVIVPIQRRWHMVTGIQPMHNMVNGEVPVFIPAISVM